MTEKKQPEKKSWGDKLLKPWVKNSPAIKALKDK